MRKSFRCAYQELRAEPRSDDHTQHEEYENSSGPRRVSGKKGEEDRKRLSELVLVPGNARNTSRTHAHLGVKHSSMQQSSSLFRMIGGKIHSLLQKLFPRQMCEKGKPIGEACRYGKPPGVQREGRRPDAVNSRRQSVKTKNTNRREETRIVGPLNTSWLPWCLPVLSRNSDLSTHSSKTSPR